MAHAHCPLRISMRTCVTIEAVYVDRRLRGKHERARPSIIAVVRARPQSLRSRPSPWPFGRPGPGPGAHITR